MLSPIEETIEDILEYIDGCKSTAFSSSKITVNRDELEALISELKAKVPVELNKYQKVIKNEQAILKNAEKKAQEIIDSAKIKTDELISEHQIMQQAYAQANEVVMIATNTAQNTVDSAQQQANEIRTSAIKYTDDLLKNIQEILVKSIETTRSRQDSYINTMQGYLDIITENRIQLAPNPVTDNVIKPSSSNKEVKENNDSEEIVLPEILPVDETATSEQAPVYKMESKEIEIPESFFKKD